MLSVPDEQQLSSEQLAEARRVADELVKLYRDGAIKTKGDASFYANLIRDFRATYTGQTERSGKTPFPSLSNAAWSGVKVCTALI